MPVGGSRYVCEKSARVKKGGRGARLQKSVRASKKDLDAQIAASLKAQEAKQMLETLDVVTAPPPNMKKRQLIFDSLSKIVSRTYGSKSSQRSTNPKNNTSKGTCLFTWGAGYHGQLGRPYGSRAQRKYALVPEEVPALKQPIRQITCGSLHTAAVTDSGVLYTWGDARKFQLGYTGETHQEVPRMVDSIVGHCFITQVSCGEGHTVALTDRFTLLSWGKNKFGQCGHGDRQKVQTPKQVLMEGFVKFAEISCGEKHTIAVTTQGEAYSFGLGKHGQLGHGTPSNQNPDCLKPKMIEGLRGHSIVSSSGGAIHSTFLSDTGQMFCSGFGEYFYQGEENFHYTPVLIEFDHPIVQNASGQSHILALDSKGDVYAWGSGMYGQLGHGVKGNLNKPRLVLANKSIAQVAAGRYHSVALTTFGALYSWGCGETGQLGHQKSDSNIFVPKVVEHNLGTVVGQISCGEHHTAVLTSTQWKKVDPEVLEWLRAEQEEYNLKQDFLKHANRGLGKADLEKIESTMAEVLESWEEAKKQGDEFTKKEEEEKIRQIRRRKSMSLEVTRDLDEARAIAETNARRRANGESPVADGARTPDMYSGRPGSSRAGARTSSASGQRGQRSAVTDGFSILLPSVADDLDDNKHSSSRIPPRGFSRGARTGASTARTRNTKSSQSSFRSPRIQGSVQRSDTAEQFDGDDDQLQVTRRRPATARRSAQGKVTSARAEWLKQTSEQLRSMKAVIAQSGEAANRVRLRQTTRQTFLLRREYDSLVHKVAQKKNQVRECKRDLKGLSTIDDGSEKKKSIEYQLKQLDMKLNTVQIKIAETVENKKNYEVNISHLKDEELARHYQLEELRRQVTLEDNNLRKMNEVKLTSLEEKAKAEEELITFQQEIEGYQGFVGDQFNKFAVIASASRRRKEESDLEREVVQRAKTQKVSARIDKLNEEMDEKEKEAHAMQQSLDSVEERLRYFEKRFQQISSATGLVDPDAIINKFNLKEEIKNQLRNEIAAKEERKRQIETDTLELKQKSERIKEAYHVSKWKDVEQSEENRRAGVAHIRQLAVDHSKLTSKLAFFREGLLLLHSALPGELHTDESADVLPENAEWTAEATLNLFSGVNDTLVALQEKVQALEQKRAEEREAEERLLKEQQETELKAKAIFQLAMRPTNRFNTKEEEVDNGGASAASSAAADKSDNSVDPASGEENTIPDN